MDGSLHVLVRWALYLDLALTAGLPLAGLLAFRRHAARVALVLGLRRLLIVLAVLGLLLSLCHLAMLAQAMSGAAAMTDLDGEVFATVLGHTDAGTAWWIRIAALCAIALLALRARSRAGLPIRSLSTLGAVSLATVAWTGHAAMDEGARAYLHMAADIIHLIAAAAWIGALAVFALLLRPRQAASLPRLRLLHLGLSRFAWQGTAIVLALTGTGVVNYCLAASPRLSGLMTTQYGLLLLAKLALVAAMIGLAAGNRYRLVPALGQAIEARRATAATSALRWSVLLEAGAATAILAIVAWLGMLDPSPPS
ncbi:Copper resistance protein D [Bordetella sputigena]|uniref:copper homeostasis membrane protein CopD n=1 Tax=Bordetella sputigena TaxID=1416810 RepID=UPI0039EFAB65